jgi:O-glycosyl hydrolase
VTPWWKNGLFYNDQFLNLLIDSLGLALLRTELYPQPDQTGMYTKQIPYLRAIKAKAQASGEPLTVFASIRSPPSRMKTGGSTTSGNMIADSIDSYGRYCVDYVRRFNTDMGYDLYALSPQNEPQLCTGYNSMCPSPELMGRIVVGVANQFKQANLPCWIHYADGIPWGAMDWQGVVVQAVDSNRIADSIADIMSMHYSEGGPVSATTVSKNDEYFGCLWNFAQGGIGCQGWQHHRSMNIGKKSRMWNTEFGGQFDSWTETYGAEGGSQAGGAWTFATNLFMCLKYNFNAVVYWQLSEPGGANPPAANDHYVLFHTPANGASSVSVPGPLFRVAQTVYRHVRPGAMKVECTSSDSANVWAVAYRQATQNTVTIVLLNRSSSQQTVTLAGNGLPASMDIYQTSPSQNHVKVGTVGPTGTVTLPVKSITTLCNIPTVSVRPVAPSDSRAARTLTDQKRTAVVFGLSGRQVGVANEQNRLRAGMYFTSSSDGRGLKPIVHAVAGR